MIASIMVYGMATAFLFALAALATERGLAAMGLPRRGAWVLAMVASCAFPIAMMLGTVEKQAVVDRPATLSATGPARRLTEVTTNAFEPVAVATIQLAARRANTVPALNTCLAAAWLLGSCGLGLFYAVSWFNAHRATGRWRTATVDGQQVTIGDDDVGPAIFGFRRPRIIIPQWLLDTSEAFQRVVIQHERQHLQARDQLSLLLGLALVVIAPWNLPLWWQLRRLRFAIEVDCDARVLNQGVDPLAYGEVLLQVGRRHMRGPATAIALIEPPSDLERRIRVLMSDGKRSVVAAIGCLMLCASLVVGAAQLNPPRKEQQQQQQLTLLAPAKRSSAFVRELLEANSPQLFDTSLTQRVLVTMILDANNEIEWIEIREIDEQNELFETAFPSPSLEKRFRPGEVRGVGQVLLERAPTAAVPRPAPIHVMYASRSNPTTEHPRHSRPMKATERAMIERYFPKIVDGSSNPHEQLWLVLDRNGHVINAGSDPFYNFNQAFFLARLDALHPGAANAQRDAVLLQDLFDREMPDTQGKPLFVTFVWLEDSLPPRPPRPAPGSLVWPIEIDVQVFRNGELVNKTRHGPLIPGMTRRVEGPQLRMDVTAQSAQSDVVLLSMILQTPASDEDAQSADGWQTIAAPRIATKPGQPAAVEMGVPEKGSATPVSWRVEVVPRRVERQ